MIKEVHITGMKEKLNENPEAKFYICMREPPKDLPYEVGRVETSAALSPSAILTRDYKGKLVNWTGYITRFYKEMKSPVVQKIFRVILLESAERDIYLVCSCSPKEGKYCHRFLLLDILDNLKSAYRM
jgi:uncharacterized protein YeaO (DUF488 family)